MRIGADGLVVPVPRSLDWAVLIGLDQIRDLGEIAGSAFLQFGHVVLDTCIETRVYLEAAAPE